MTARVDGTNTLFPCSEHLVLINNPGVGFAGFLSNFLRIVLLSNLCPDLSKQKISKSCLPLKYNKMVLLRVREILMAVTLLATSCLDFSSPVYRSRFLFSYVLNTDDPWQYIDSISACSSEFCSRFWHKSGKCKTKLKVKKKQEMKNHCQFGAWIDWKKCLHL